MTVKMVKAENKKDGRIGIAAIDGSGRVLIDFLGGESTDVAESTFKRNYKVLEEVPVPEVKPELAAPVSIQAGLEASASVRLLKWEMSGTKGGKCDKVVNTIELDGMLLDITEYNGFITDVRVSEIEKDGDMSDPDSIKELYRSPKASLKDTLKWMGYAEEMQAAIRKEITAIRKLARNGVQ